MLDDRSQPGWRTVRVEPRRVPEEDLKRPLIGILSIFGTETVAPCGTQKAGGMALNNVEDEGIELLLGRRLADRGNVVS